MESVETRANRLRKQWAHMNTPFVLLNISVANGMVIMSTKFLSSAAAADAELQCYFPLPYMMILCGLSAIAVLVWQSLGRFLVDVVVSDAFMASRRIHKLCKAWAIFTLTLALVEAVLIGATSMLVFVNFFSWQDTNPSASNYCEGGLMLFASIVFPTFFIMGVVGLLSILVIGVNEPSVEWPPLYYNDPIMEDDKDIWETN